MHLRLAPDNDSVTTLLICATTEVAYDRVFAPAATPLEEAARAAGSRWAVEVAFDAITSASNHAAMKYGRFSDTVDGMQR